MHRHVAGALTGRYTKWAVLVFWIVAVMGLGGFAGKLTSVQNNEASSWLPASAESTAGFKKMEPFQDPNTIPTVIVYERTTGLTADDKAAAAADVASFAKLDGVEGEITGPIPSKDGQALETIIKFNLGKDGWNKMPDTVKEIRKIAETDGMSVHVAGAGGQAADAVEAFGGLDSTLLFAALGIVILILLVVYRSPTLWFLPIFSAVVSLGTTMGLVYFLAKYAGLTVNGQSQAILSILCIGAGTDYALLLVARYREELRNYADRHEAMAHALHRAAPAILASAATVILGMLCLTFADMSSTAGMGPVVAIGVAMTYLVMVTLLPALLVITGRWMFWPMRPTFGSVEPTQSGMWARIGKRIAIRPRTVWVGTTVVLAIACLGLFRLDANGLSTEDTYTKEFDSIKGQKVLAAHDLVDQSNQLLVVANADKLPAVATALEGVDGIVDQKLPGGGTVKVVPLGQPKDGVGALSVVIGSDVSSQASFDVVNRTRDAVHAVKGADALVTGGSAIYLDTKVASQRDDKVIIPLVLAVVLLVLIALLRAVAAPLILLGTVILSFGAALGISVLLFEYVFGFAGSDPSFPLFAFVFLVALGIDYNIFLMTRVREEAASHGTRRGALVGLTSTGGVITSAGVVLAATFIVLGTLPLVFLAEMGIAVALGVMLDTMIVRSILVTAINIDLGDKIWWPSKLGQGRTDPEPTPELVEA
ncbi:MMPL family transporter [Nocardioides jiangxiensis]|uniref:MMPL family transporter n=1 Tax=Nocardioides jiangxiensis TaxID=3064524 RepID=A0ABT9B314_9ACTN|nr:MMPL family transporter [Nocardioides sp. WY-20]MDO7869246.1 MMPL family transporter [Nocardioides sp. WY-20]